MALSLAQWKAKAEALGVTELQVSQIGNVRYKDTWKTAIGIQEHLNQEAEKENAKAKRDQIYKSPGAAVIVPVAGLAAYGHALVNGVRRCL